MEKRRLDYSKMEHDACGIGAIVSIDGVMTHKTVDDALKIVEKLEHRAGKDAAGETGDGVGILLQISHKFFQKAAAALGISLDGSRDYAVGMFFLPNETLKRNQAKKRLEIITQKEGMEFLGWRDVPTQPEILGQKARDCMPYIAQCFVRRPKNVAQGLDFDRKLYIVRREFEQSNENTYVASFSSRTIVYKGMFLVGQLRNFYLDLQDEDYDSAIALVHSRFSTNTTPSWERAHPNRLILHNGEINTIRGNADRMLSREETMSSPLMQAAADRILPVINNAGSDSAMLDNTLEFMMMNGMDLPLAMMVLIPEAWNHNKNLDRERRDMYHYYATMMEPWDGPASILFSDGDLVGALLDRNGLRPSRYYVTSDNYLILSSEVGVLDVDPTMVVKKDRVRPGKMLLVDTKSKKIIDDADLKHYYAARRPYGEWLDQNLIYLKDLPVPNKKVESLSDRQRERLQNAFAYSYEDLTNVILPMAQNGAEPTAAMGVDVPLAVLSEKHQPLFRYFKQTFAQVTNPPIDAIREESVTDTTVFVGSDGNLLQDDPKNCTVLQINNPILTNVDLMKIKNMDAPGFHVATISILYYKNTSLKKALDHLFVSCDRAYRSGANIIILSDRGVDENHVAIPSLLAVSALEQYLIRTKKRTAISVILESAEPRDVHHFATLLGYGARAVNPYLAYASIRQLIHEGLLDKDYSVAVDDYNKAVLSGIVKIASKMGISTIQSYESAQIFEVVGIRQDVVDNYFTNTVSRVGGVGLEEIAEGVEFYHSRAFDPLGMETDTTLDSAGYHRLRCGREKEDHMYSPQVVYLLQQAVRRGDYGLFKQYTALVDNETPHTLRGLLEFCYPEEGIPLDQVEPVEQIVRRFKTGAMSYGSISQEAHECLALAMNHIGGKSNSGEGGEDPARLKTDRCSAIKQVASGRFGVTSEYLTSAQEIQIKMAQGAKPGEGGHLPGKKVYPWIAKTRHSTPGIALISPPPHHDIYSIEDLSQLIFDLKNANCHARISVKLVSENGVGTIAAGVAKAGAQVVLISGFDGGTGAAPTTSIHNAGLPWELGLAEAHQALLANGLRQQVVLEVDGKLMTGRDVAIGAMLGAEEFGFATAPLIALGCVMMRVCNLDTCPAGIATQNPQLRKCFRGKPEYVENFMYYVAQELREIMARLGLRSVDELVGRRDLLRTRAKSVSKRAESVDLSGILGDPASVAAHNGRFCPEMAYDFHLERTLDHRVLLEKMGRALKQGKPASLEVPITSTDRAFGALFGAEITRRWGNSLPENTYHVKANGGGGQSFGAFVPKGLTLELEGDSNDYFGKGLSGGTLIVYPPKCAQFKASENVIIGNVALYGATSGKAFVAGVAGERFCVRNSGAMAVVEGVGNHGCEYMTGGTVVILGDVGDNFAAGMSGGVAYVLDCRHDLYLRLNKELVEMSQVSAKHDVQLLKTLITEHVAATGSEVGKTILADLDAWLPNFKKVIAKDYRRMLELISAMEAKGMERGEAEIEAFYSMTAK